MTRSAFQLFVSEDLRRELYDKGYDLVEVLEKIPLEEGSLEVSFSNVPSPEEEGVRSKSAVFEILALGVSAYVVARGIATILRELLRAPNRVKTRTMVRKPVVDASGHPRLDGFGQPIYEWEERDEDLVLHEALQSERLGTQVSPIDGLKIELE